MTAGLNQFPSKRYSQRPLFLNMVLYTVALHFKCSSVCSVSNQLPKTLFFEGLYFSTKYFIWKTSILKTRTIKSLKEEEIPSAINWIQARAFGRPKLPDVKVKFNQKYISLTCLKSLRYIPYERDVACNYIIVIFKPSTLLHCSVVEKENKYLRLMW